MKVGPITLDPKTREVTKAGRFVELTPTEYELLRFFMRHPDKTLSGDTLLKRVWGPGFSNSRTYVVHVNRLRDRLMILGCSHLIQTVWGVGYKFVPSS